MSVNDGGPAYPRPYSAARSDYQAWEQDGMSLRDYFAGQALAGLCHKTDAKYTTGPCNAFLVERAFVIADAMIKQRESLAERERTT